MAAIDLQLSLPKTYYVRHLTTRKTYEAQENRCCVPTPHCTEAGNSKRLSSSHQCRRLYARGNGTEVLIWTTQALHMGLSV